MKNPLAGERHQPLGHLSTVETSSFPAVFKRPLKIPIYRLRRENPQRDVNIRVRLSQFFTSHVPESFPPSRPHPTLKGCEK